MLGSHEVFHARIQEFSSGGSRSVSFFCFFFFFFFFFLKKALTTFFFFFFFFSFFFSFFFFFGPQLILQKSNGQFQKNLLFFKVPEGVKQFPRGGGGGVQLFPGGVQLLIPYRNPYNL